MTISDILQRIVDALEQNSVAYMLTGSFAGAYYGTPRSTQDIDIVIQTTPGELRSFMQSLPVNQYYSDLNAAQQAVIAKLEWSKLAQSQRQINDVAAILRSRQDNLDIPHIQERTNALQLDHEWRLAKAAAGI